MSSRNRSNIVILNAKLNRPRVTSTLIVRSRLLEMLDAGLASPLTIVVAPAGFGKSTLVSSWIEELAAGKRHGTGLVPAAWLSLDESDSEPTIFLHYFISALRTIFPDAAHKTLELLTVPQPTPPKLLTGTLSNELEGLPSRFVMVLDDAHALHGQAVFDFLRSWLRHWPHPMHLVLVSRRNPPLPLPRLRAKGQMREVRSRDLRFTAAETAEYLGQALQRPLDEPELAIIQRQLEGWIAGLRLAMLSPETRANPAVLPQAVLGNDVLITDFLIDEVLLRQPPGIQRLLLNVSITRQFCESLCAVLLDNPEPDYDVRQSLDYLEINELFLTSLDNRHEWYRLHQVFRDLLQHRLRQEIGEEALGDLHSRAARWYAGHDLPDQALHHALEGKNLALVTQFMQQGICDVLNRTDRPKLERWLQMLPSEVILRRPELLIMRAWDHALRWELDLVLRTAEQAEALLDQTETAIGTDNKPVIRGQIAVLKSQAAYFSNQPERAAALCRDALALLPEEWQYVRGVAMIFLGMSLYSGGRAAEAERFLATQYEAAADKSDSFALRLLQTLALNALQSGLLETAQRTAQVLLRQSMQNGLALLTGWSHYLLGYVHYHWNELEAAERHFAAIGELRYATQLLVVRNGLVGLATVYQAQGKEAAAMAAIDDLGQSDLELYGREEVATTAARARLLFMQGDLDGADQWSEQVLLPPLDQPLLPWMDWPLLTRVAVLIARNTTADIEAAHNALDVMDEIAQRTYSTRSRVEILALRALAHMAQGNIVGARQSLIRSVELSRRTGHIRIYVDLGPPMHRLLGQIARHQTVANAVTRILAAFEAAGDTSGSGTTAANFGDHDGNGSKPADRALPQSLTTRELEVLSLLAKPLSLAEISEQLHIAHSTAKRHSINLYEKLDVHSRWEAVSAAVELGILPPR